VLTSSGPVFKTMNFIVEWTVLAFFLVSDEFCRRHTMGMVVYALLCFFFMPSKLLSSVNSVS
jgi:hypothetical protein